MDLDLVLNWIGLQILRKVFEIGDFINIKIVSKPAEVLSNKRPLVQNQN
jgi:hypothetical protein